MASNNDCNIEEIAGWAIRGWSLIPGKLLTFELMKFSLSGRESNLARLQCANPDFVSMTGFSRKFGEEIMISTAYLDKRNNPPELKFDVNKGGRALIRAKDIKIILY